ncbi:PLP-dependent lyase/thiolase [Limibaculum sp. FT325]|uniref:pyridoxal-phosphate dependent enzyme n=1 Tax=Thermohalobaculum sediminis TaxID=2939436 RepID=UPI0020BDBF24|nr:pyridoxal-phosphate dependent enzyme [Limibaculum sediminis]MCL5779202.1 PLP-dependent lyase/thiolase [Limibaculum sediminis]
MTTAPTVEMHRGIMVVRDDLFPGGTKARYIGRVFEGADEAVYASPAEGGAQTALATVARRLGKQATIFVAQRARPHPRTLEAARFGAKIVPVAPGYLSVVQSRAREYCRNTGARLIPFGAEIPGAIEAIAAAARATGLEPAEVWCAAGSGVLARGLAAAWPKVRRHVVQVGRDLSPHDIAGASIHRYPLAFGKTALLTPPFPSDPHYDAKAWETCLAKHRPGGVLFWNVAPLAMP